MPRQMMTRAVWVAALFAVAPPAFAQWGPESGPPWEYGRDRDHCRNGTYQDRERCEREMHWRWCREHPWECGKRPWWFR